MNHDVISGRNALTPVFESGRCHAGVGETTIWKSCRRTTLPPVGIPSAAGGKWLPLDSVLGTNHGVSRRSLRHYHKRTSPRLRLLWMNLNVGMQSCRMYEARPVENILRSHCTTLRRPLAFRAPRSVLRRLNDGCREVRRFIHSTATSFVIDGLDRRADMNVYCSHTA